MNSTILDKTEILARAKLWWNNKNCNDRNRVGFKYQHFLNKFKLKINDWSNDFENLSIHQKNIIIKGELIRTYDSLPNIIKTNIMHEFGLSSFSSKWYKLPGKDKKILLNFVLK